MRTVASGNPGGSKGWGVGWGDVEVEGGEEVVWGKDWGSEGEATGFSPFLLGWSDEGKESREVNESFATNVTWSDRWTKESITEDAVGEDGWGEGKEGEDEAVVKDGMDWSVLDVADNLRASCKNKWCISQDYIICRIWEETLTPAAKSLIQSLCLMVKDNGRKLLTLNLSPWPCPYPVNQNENRDER